MFRRPGVTVLLLLCALILAVGDTGRPAPGYAAVALKAGDVLFSSWKQVGVADGSTGVVSTVSLDPHLSVRDAIAAGPKGEVYVADSHYNVDDFTTTPAIARVDPATGVPTVITSGGFGDFVLGGLVADGAGMLYVVEKRYPILQEVQNIVRVDPANGTRVTVVTFGRRQLLDPSGLAIEADGSLLTTIRVPRGGEAREIIRLRTAIDDYQVVSTGGNLVRPTAVAVGPDGQILVADVGGNLTPPRVLRIDPQSGAQAVVTQFNPANHARLTAIAVDAAGQIFVARDDSTWRGDIVSIDPVTGAQRQFINNSSIPNIWGLAVVKVASPLACPGPPRPRVTVQTTRLGNGRLQVNVRATGSTNAVQSVRPGTVPNAVVEGTPVISGLDASFVLRRTGPGAVTLPFTVTDACGEWRTFVGGGAGSF